MSKLFTKYLPVGEVVKDTAIEIDEFYFDNQAGLVKRLAGSWILHSNGTKTQYPCGSEPRKAKLFLCSRDISPEDYVNNTLEIHIYHDGSEEPFKVLGEVSHNAIWVKEGMEFEEDDIRLPKNNMFVDEHDYYEFKCSNCGTFH